ncbi:MAG: iduronate-2-sulfatase [Pirellulaceae bacterium]|nr:MAG: iduronate-2-sulfatase [Pirellulaceae bacterium]
MYTCRISPWNHKPRVDLQRAGKWIWLALGIWLAATVCRPSWGQSAGGPADGRPNVLLILVDDLKPALGCYGDPVAVTPSIDRLAARGMRFDRAYCSQAVCAPSRFALMLASHPTSTGLYHLGSRLRRLLPDAVTLPQHFIRHGYHAESLGKVFHVGHGNPGDPQSFSLPPFEDKVIEYRDPLSRHAGQLTREEAYFTNQFLDRIASLPRGMAFEALDLPDEAYADGRIAQLAIQRLQQAAERRRNSGQPFFLAVGFVRPHLPFCVPRKYWELYDPDKLPLPRSVGPPQGAPAVAIKRGGEITNYEPVPPDGKIEPLLARKLIHGYYASISYTDAQIGKLLDALDRLSITDQTIVVLWGDHGFHLGDHGFWTKHTNYEEATRVPLIFACPDSVRAGTHCEQLVESVDIFPTLAELAGLPPPQGPQPIDGKSLVPLLRDGNSPVRDHAYHCYPKAKLGRAVRTARYRLVVWSPIRNDARSSEIEYELYDYSEDPEETRNLAEERPQVVQELLQLLDQHPVRVLP